MEKRPAPEREAVKEKKIPAQPRPEPVKKLKFSFKEQREFETIDDDIAALEEKLEQLKKDMDAACSDYVRLQELMAQQQELELALEEKMERWMYLNDLAEKIAAQK